MVLVELERILHLFWIDRIYKMARANIIHCCGPKLSICCSLISIWGIIMLVSWLALFTHLEFGLDWWVCFFCDYSSPFVELCCPVKARRSLRTFLCQPSYQATKKNSAKSLPRLSESRRKTAMAPQPSTASVSSFAVYKSGSTSQSMAANEPVIVPSFNLYEMKASQCFFYLN